MIEPDLVIRNGRLVLGDSVVQGGIAVKDGKIAAIAADAALPRVGNEIDAHGNFVLPGLIDCHVHFSRITEETEDFRSGTQAAAAGGLTTIFDMPGSDEKAVLDAVTLDDKRKEAESLAFVDFGLYGGAGKGNIAKISEMAQAGAIGFKTFMLRETSYSVDNDIQLYQVLEETARTGRPNCIHAENPDLVDYFAQRLIRAGRKDPIAHAESRPNICEVEAISRLFLLGKHSGARVHIVHMSTKEGVPILAQAKDKGQTVSAETCPQYLLLTKETMRKLGPYAKINPPLREEDDIKALWDGLSSGVVDIIASDHAPYTKEEKDLGRDDIWKAGPGNPGVETMVPLLLTKVNEGRLSIARFAEAMSTRVARLFGIYPKKGSLQVGSDADFTIVDMRKESVIEAGKLYTKSRALTLYDGWKVKGLPIMSVVRGAVVMQEGKVVGEEGYGRFVAPLTS